MGRCILWNCMAGCAGRAMLMVMSEREAARQFGIDRKTVSKILKHSVPPGYRRNAPPQRPKLDPFVPVIDRILEDDKSKLKKQRHTAKRIHARLRDEHGFTGGITIVTDYVREKKRRTREVFVPLSHAPGHAQVDFGETLGVIAGVECKLHYFAMAMPHSDAFFIKTYPAETTEAFCDGHNAAFAFFGGVPLSILYDNTTIAVAKILRRRGPVAHPCLFGIAVALPVRRQIRSAGQGKRQGQRRRRDRLWAAELPRARTPVRQLRCV